MATASRLSSVANRARSLLGSRRVRAAIVLIGAYKGYHFFNNNNILYKTFSAPRHRPGQTVLDLDLDSVSIVLRESRSFFTSGEELRLQNLIAALHAAKADPRVTGLVVRGINGISGIGLAELSELREAIRDFSTGWGGKHTLLHVPEGIGISGNGTIPLYFASGFDSVHCHPTSTIVIPGLSLATLFFKRLMGNLGLKAKTLQRKEYKTAGNALTEEGFTAPERESTEALLNAIMTDVVKNVAGGRKLTEEQVWKAIDTAIMSPEEAQQLGVIDNSLYRDELPAYMRKRLCESAQLRQETRKEAEREWRQAMEELKNVWMEEDGWYNYWGNGRLIRDVTNFHVAVSHSIYFSDKKQDTTNRATDAEIRALKAHLKWLDTCPWEAIPEEEHAKGTVYHAIPHISMLIEAERAVCHKAIRALEELPKLVAKHRHEDKDVLTLDEGNFMPFVRWCRSAWIAKCIAARIVGSLADTEDNVKSQLRSVPEDEVTAKVKEGTFEPRLFLVGYADEFYNGKADPKEEQVANLLEASDASDSESVDVSEDDAGKAPEKTMEPHEKLILRYVRFADYIDTIGAEKRAAAERGMPMLTRSHPKGPIDNQEKQMMLRLQLPGHRIAPWRMMLPKGDIIAVINIDGTISDDSADATRSAIRRADKDPQVKAIVLRINSGGGSATASDLISRAVEVAKKPVVASMGSVCASGGYFIAAPCKKVFASNTTITGSIGVLFQSFNTAGLFEKVGITADSVESGRFAQYFGTLGSITEWSEEFSTRMNGMIDKFYADFLGAVSRGRHMKMEDTEKVARGRVWAGSDALRLGLVDEIGGLRDAIDAAADFACLAPDMEVKAVDYPTMGMLVQEAARRRGVMPAHLDEEGDEAVPDRRRRRFWFQRQDPESADQSDDGMDVGPAHAATGAAATLSLQDYLHLPHFIFAGLISSLDRYLITATAPTLSTGIIEALLGKAASVLSKGKPSTAIAEELERAKATSGRPAALAPSLHVDDRDF